MITIHGSGVTVMLPHQPAFSAPIVRQVAELIALDGSTIRQVSAYQTSARKLTYSGPVRESVAFQLRTMIGTSASVVVAPGDGHAYTATINNLVAPAFVSTSNASVVVSFECALSAVIA
jgi:Flp pilus assembly CpaF family ATPase